MAKNGKNLPVRADKAGQVAVIEAEVLDAYTFMDASGFAAVKENIGDQKLTPTDFERIQFPSGGGQLWQIPTLDGEIEGVKSIDGIVIMKKDTRVYWASAYTGDKIPPDCASSNAIVGMGNPGGLCATCPLSQWGSDQKGSGGQACKQVGILFLMKPYDQLPIVVPVPPTSLVPIKRFMLKLANQKLRYFDCVISLGLEMAQNKGGIKYSKIKPRLIAQLPDVAKLQIKEYVDQFRDVFAKITATADDVGAATDTD